MMRPTLAALFCGLSTQAPAQTVDEVADAMLSCLAFVTSDASLGPIAGINAIHAAEPGTRTCDLSAPDPAVFEAAATQLAALFPDPTIQRIDIGIPGFEQLSFGGCIGGRKINVGINGFAAAGINSGTANIAWREVFDTGCPDDTPQSKVTHS